MNNRKYHFILVLISVVIAATLAIQLYWNYNNFKESKRVLISEMQSSLDRSVDLYYGKLIKKNNIGIIVQETTNRKPEFDQLFKNLDSTRRAAGFKGFNLENMTKTNMREIMIMQGEVNLDSLNARVPMSDFWNFPNYQIQKPDANVNQLKSETFFADQNNLQEVISTLTAKMVLSIQEGEMNLQLMDSLVSKRLEKQNINVKYKLSIAKTDRNDALIAPVNKNVLRANSELIQKGDALLFTYSGLSPTIYKLNLTGIVLSGLLIAAVVLCLFYLLHIIRKQKALSEMKNDLISNITHEFKTPIATASVALEGVQSFTTSGDVQKTNRYLSMSREELIKLNSMVERILETATLDSKELMLQKSPLDLNELIEILVNKHKDQTNKKLIFDPTSDHVFITADAFHLENAINNLVDNAIKYGGDKITILLKNKTSGVNITVTDNGNGLSNKDVKLIFDKFYRVAKGNRHDVKGFGIGLFYTKSIIEKHKGNITAVAQPQTTFNIFLPHE